MNIGRTNSARALSAGVLFAILVFVVLLQYAPDSVALSPNNYGWNGLEGVSSAYALNFTTSLSSVPSRSVLVIMQPSVNFSRADAAAVHSLLLGGGTVLVADKSGVANSLLQKLSSAISIQSQYAVSDPIYNWKEKTVPTALVLPSVRARNAYLSNVKGIAVSQPSPLILANSQASDIAITSQFSYETNAGGASTQSVVAKGPFVVMASQKFGNGTLLVVGDSQFLFNSEWSIADNKVLLANLFAGANVFIDASHWNASPLTSSTAQLKSEMGQLYATISPAPLRYFVALAFIAVSLALVPRPDKPADTPESLTIFNREVPERERAKGK